MTSHVHHVTIDCADAYKLGTFWAEVLGSSLADDDFPGDPEALVESPGAALLFVTVPEPKSVKNRIHFDIQPDDRTRDEEVERLLALGATLVADRRRPDGRGWATLADPEGNEFCVECSAGERARLTGKRLPVTADDVTSAVRLTVDTLAGSPAEDWRIPAGTLTWDCWETVEHLSDDLFAYAVQLGPRRPPLETEVPYRWAPEREGGPWNAIFADPEAGTAGLLQTLEASGALLSAMVRTASPISAPTTPTVSRTRRGSPRWASWRPSSTPTTSPRASASPGRRPPTCATGCWDGSSPTPRPTRTGGPCCSGPPAARICRAGSA